MARLVIRGDVHLTLDAVARCYNVRLQWLTEVYELGLLGPGEHHGASVAIPARRLDRAARVIQLHFHHGLGLMEIDLYLLRREAHP